MENEKNTDKRFLKSKIAIEKAIEKAYETGKTLSSVTVSEITKLANVTRKTFYLHYKDLNDFINQFITETVDSILNNSTVNASFNTFSNAITDILIKFTKAIYGSKIIELIAKNAEYGSTFFATLKTKIKESFKKTKENKDLGYLLEFISSGLVSTYEMWLAKKNDQPYSKDFETELSELTKNILSPFEKIFD